MKSTLVLLLSALAATAAAQQRQDYFPECSMKCIDDAIKKATTCSLEDAVCMCVQKNYEDIYNQAVNCVLQACGSNDAISKVLPAGGKFCSAVTAQAKTRTASPTGPAASGSAATATATGNASAATTTSATAATGAAASSTSTGGAVATAGPAPIVALVAAGLMAAL
ncbi:hypothetical protein JDV02_005512 [Purpureocillium takamizusanense]|uniref:CFEM domain-containing protein n=1 Tax=Purpureocillium takamizusanense TaxID=2060973 RepID=A0A9Q8QI73_9HYPO|nr:uncharacterized protein JDV02_005512 [Purpureocillium takamizusanense]UNI19321.1 hypothetical protein JDV02_005512 [Purpureocillium takamizusanense]